MKIQVTVLLLLLFNTGITQNMQALHGSPYAGSMAVDYNPAGILNAPYKWDVTILGVQEKSVTNGFYLDKYSLLSSSDTVYARGRNGYYSRYAHASATVNLFHIRYQFNNKHAFSIGGNVRSYVNARTSNIFYSQQSTFPRIVAQNLTNGITSGAMTSSSWAELTMAYAHVITSNELGKWQAGVQLSVMRALSGAYAAANSIQITPAADLNDALITAGNSQYGYSSNYDRLDSNNSTLTNIRNFMQGMKMNVGLSLGVEYIKYQDDASPFTEPRSDDYDWKLSMSLLDIGTNTFSQGRYSAKSTGVKPGVYASTIGSKFGNIDRVSDLTDSLRTVAGQVTGLGGKRFTLRNPTRFIVNFDKQFDNDCFLNAEIQLNTGKVRNTLFYNTQELTVAAVTVRKETGKWGVYMPLQYTTGGKVWLGLAGKAGPLLIGLHNLAWLFGKNSFPNGGAYLLLRVYPGNRKEKDRSIPCPP